eukprot:357371-Chlamydomonas_euryale.AAC.2
MSSGIVTDHMSSSIVTDHMWAASHSSGFLTTEKSLMKLLARSDDKHAQCRHAVGSMHSLRKNPGRGYRAEGAASLHMWSSYGSASRAHGDMAATHTAMRGKEAPRC